MGGSLLKMGTADPYPSDQRLKGKGERTNLPCKERLLLIYP